MLANLPTPCLVFSFLQKKTSSSFFILLGYGLSVSAITIQIMSFLFFLLHRHCISRNIVASYSVFFYLTASGNKTTNERLLLNFVRVCRFSSFFLVQLF